MSIYSFLFDLIQTLRIEIMHKFGVFEDTAISFLDFPTFSCSHSHSPMTHNFCLHTYQADALTVTARKMAQMLDLCLKPDRSSQKPMHYSSLPKMGHSWPPIQFSFWNLANKSVSTKKMACLCTLYIQTVFCSPFRYSLAKLKWVDQNNNSLESGSN